MRFSRWLTLLGAVAVQLAIGGVYAWSVIARSLRDERAMGLSPMAASLPFQAVIGMIFVGAFVGGRWQDRSGPRLVALAGVVVYSAGIMLASLAREPGDLWLLILGYGIIGGFGLGLAYIVPLAMLQKLFPDKAALVTGLAVAGFGFGAVITSPVAQALITARPEAPAAAFGPIGLGYLIVGGLGAMTFRNPPITSPAAATGTGMSVAEALRTPQWYLLTLTLALAVMTGISLVSVAASAMIEIPNLTPTAAASAVGMLGLFNGAGRVVWAGISDKLGKTTTLSLILVLLGLALVALPHATHAAVFLVLAAVIYTCYGGAFGVLPSTAGQFFGLAQVGAIYGLMLVGWSVGGVLGPMLTSALVGDQQRWVLAFTSVGLLGALGAIVPLLAARSRKQVRRTDERPPG